MIKRYPHTSIVKYRVEVDNGTSIPDVMQYLINLTGRFEPVGRNANLNYKAKFYCPKSSFRSVMVGGKETVYLQNNDGVFITDNNGVPLTLGGLESLTDDNGDLLIDIAGKELNYMGKSYVITQIFPYQRHCEIWLD